MPGLTRHTEVDRIAPGERNMSGLDLPQSSLALGLLATVAWGFWAFFAKLATRSGHPATILLVTYVVASSVGAAFFLTGPGTVEMTNRDLLFAVAAGVSTGVGSVLYYLGLSNGDVGRISTIVALYFVVSVLLGVLVLDEALTTRKVAGIGFGIVAVFLLSS